MQVRTAAFAACMDETAQFDLAWPLPPKHGRDAIHDAFLTLLHEAFTGLHRRALLFFGQNNIRAQAARNRLISCKACWAICMC